MIILKKYDNRKIYSQDLASYVSHDEIIHAIKEGFEIKVLTKDGKDVTKEVEVELVRTFLKSNPLTSKGVASLFKGKAKFE